MATRMIHGAFMTNPSSGSLQSQVEKLRPTAGFGSKILFQSEKKSSRGVGHVSLPIIAMRSARVEPEILPVTPEDVPKVLFFFPSFLDRVFLFFMKCNAR